MTLSFDDCLAQAQALRAEGKTEAALAQLESAFLTCGLAVKRYDRLATEFRAVDRRDRAIACLRKACLLSPESPRLWAQISRMCFENADHSASIPYFRFLLYLIPGQPTALSLLPVSLHRAGRLGEVEPHACAALVINPRDRRVLRSLAAALMGLSVRAGDVGNYLNRFIVMDPDDVDGYLAAGSFHAIARRYERAEELLRAGFERDPDNAEARFWLGRVLRALGWHEESVIHLDRAVELEPVHGFERDVLDLTAKLPDFGGRQL